MDGISRDVSLSFTDFKTPGLVASFEVTVLVNFSQFVFRGFLCLWSTFKIILDLNIPMV